MNSIQAISLWNPYAALVAHGEKIIETRSWGTDYTGWLLIHAAVKYPTEARAFSTIPDVQEALDGKADFVCGEPIMPRGGYVGIARVVCSRRHQGEIVRVSTKDEMRSHFEEIARGDTGTRGRPAARLALTPQEKAFGIYDAGRFAWYLADARPLPRMIPAIGRQRLFKPDPAAVNAVLAQFPDLLTQEDR